MLKFSDGAAASSAAETSSPTTSSRASPTNDNNAEIGGREFRLNLEENAGMPASLSQVNLLIKALTNFEV